MKGKPRILIVDDEPQSADIMAHLFTDIFPSLSKTRDFLATIAIGGEMALRLMRDSGPFDFVLTDGNMEDMDGIDFMLAVRAGKTEGINGTSRWVPIGLLTAWGQEEYIHRDFKISDFEFILRKPVDSRKVFEYVCRAIT
ncbi:MAG TPA: response regulator [Pyrinomonadaceae bacterium]|nr:response regulator [Pyrinomonadaceae bacterium]